MSNYQAPLELHEILEALRPTWDLLNRFEIDPTRSAEKAAGRKFMRGAWEDIVIASSMKADKAVTVDFRLDVALSTSPTNR